MAKQDHIPSIQGVQGIVKKIRNISISEEDILKSREVKDKISPDISEEDILRSRKKKVDPEETPPESKIEEEDILRSGQIKDKSKKLESKIPTPVLEREEDVLGKKKKEITDADEKSVAKKKIVSNAFIKVLAKDLGCKVATEVLGSDVTHWYSFDCAPLDIVLGGGIPSGKVIEAFGWESSGKCLNSNTYVQIVGNIVKKVGDIVIGDKLLSVDQNLRLSTTEVLAIEKNEQECFEIILRDGKVISSSSNHPYLTVLGWKKLENLKIGDSIAVPRFIPSDNSVEDVISEEEAEVIGLFLGDGSLKDRTPRLHLGPAKLDVQARLKQLIGIIGKGVENFEVTDPHNKKDSKGFSVSVTDKLCEIGNGTKNRHPNSLKVFFERVGISGLTNKDKIIPSCIMEGSDSLVIACLRGLFATDGCLRVKLNLPSISFSQNSEIMMRQVQHLLLRLGILSKIKLKNSINQSGKRFPNWNLDVLSRDSIKKYLEIIGDYNQDMVRDYLSILKSHEQKDQWDSIPKEIFTYIDKVRPKDKTWNQLFPKIREKDVRKLNSSRSQVGCIGTILNDKYLLDLSGSDIYWDQIKDIKSIGLQETIDLQTESTNFVANDIFVHNSTLALEGSKAFTKYWSSRNDDNYVVLWLESESALDKVRAQYMGCDLSRFVVQEVETAEDGFKTIKHALEKAKENGLKVLIVWDTIAAVLTDSEKATGEWNTKGMGEKARLIRLLLKDVNKLLGQTDSTLIFVNQMYKTFALYGEKDEVPGGGGIKFHASIRALMKRVGPPLEVVLPDGNKMTKGIEVDLYTKKNKLTLPYQTCKLVIYGESGIDTVETLVKFLTLHKYIETRGGWKYIEFNDKEYKFQNPDQLREIIEVTCPELKIYMNYLCYGFMSSVSPLLKVKLLGKLWDFELQLYGEKKTKISDEEFTLATLLGREILEEQDRII